jgi:hypothetical protein
MSRIDYQEAFDNLRCREASEAGESVEPCEDCGKACCTCREDAEADFQDWKRLGGRGEEIGT